MGTVDDQSVQTYEDMGLAVGRVYRYKVRVSGLNGVSDYTGEVETRTLLPEEVTPVIRNAITDKLGSKVILTLDAHGGREPPDGPVRDEGRGQPQQPRPVHPAGLTGRL